MFTADLSTDNFGELFEVHDKYHHTCSWMYLINDFLGASFRTFSSADNSVKVLFIPMLATNTANNFHYDTGSFWSTCFHRSTCALLHVTAIGDILTRLKIKTEYTSLPIYLLVEGKHLYVRMFIIHMCNKKCNEVLHLMLQIHTCFITI